MDDSTSAAPTRVLLVVSGLADPVGDWTPLSDAGTPQLDRMARTGRVGLLHAPAWTPWEAFTSVLGFEPSPPLGACAALGVGEEPGDDEVVFRADWVTATEERVLDPRAGDIDGVEAEALLAELGDVLPDIRLRRLSGARNLALLPRSTLEGAAHVAPPICAMGRRLRSELPDGPLRALVETSLRRLTRHDVNEVRVDLGENPATALWLHGGGRLPARPESSWLGDDIVLVGPGEEYAGLAGWVGWRHVGCGAGDAAMVAAALDVLDAGVTLVLHAHSVLESLVPGTPEAKRAAISYLDARVVGPLLGALEERGPFSMAVVSGGVVSSGTRRWCHDDLPFVVASSELKEGTGSAVTDGGFSESVCAGSGLHLHHAAELARLFAG